MDEGTEEKVIDQQDRDSIIYHKGFSKGQEHQRSSPETLKKLAQMSEDITNLKVDTGEIRSDVKYLVKSLDAHITEEKSNRESYDKALKEKADKSEVKGIQENLNKVVWIILVAVIGAVLSLVIIK
jgi:hypothetical protein